VTVVAVTSDGGRPSTVATDGGRPSTVKAAATAATATATAVTRFKRPEILTHCFSIF